jgi:O-antigen ligase
MIGSAFEESRGRSEGLRGLAYLNKMANKTAILFAVALFGYPVVGSVISLLQLDSRTLSIPFRILVGLFSLWILLVSRRLKIDGLRQVMLIIWLLYIVRLLHDWLVPDLPGADYALQFFIIAAVLPALALIKAQAYRWRQFALIAFLVATTGALMGMFGAIFGGADVQDAGATAGRLSLSALNPVTLGNQAASAMLCGVVLWRDAGTWQRLFLAATFVLLACCLVLTGSKGPVLQLIICMGLWALRRGHVLKLGLLALPMLFWLIFATDNPLVERLSQSSDDASTVDRLVMITDSLDQIADSPLIGSAFVELNSGFYPHNVFVEAGLAFGVPIALVFAGMLLIGVGRAWSTLRTNYDLLGLLYIQGLLDATIAGSIYGMTQVWLVLAIIPAAAVAARSRPAR